MRRLAVVTLGMAALWALVSALLALSGGLPTAAAGAWRVGHTGLRDVRVEARPPARLLIDGQIVSEQLSDVPAAPQTIWLTAGYHSIAVERGVESDPPNHAGFVQGAPGGELVEPRRGDLAAAMPSWPGVWAGLAHLANFAWIAFMSLGAALVVALLRRLLQSQDEAGVDVIRQARRQKLFRRAAIAACICVVSYGALLRLNAITATYGPVTGPRWVRATQVLLLDVAGAITPKTWRFDPAPSYPHVNGTTTRYRSDPYTYLQYGREMRWFYSAHYREPVFPFATRVWLRVLGNQDVAVSFASVTFSIAAIVMTYLIGSLAFSRLVGLGAAFLLAIEHDVISWDIAGWRDTAFVCAVLVVVHALLRFRRSPTSANAAWFGVAAGLACLVRITSLSFALPAMASMLFVWTLPRRERAGPLVIAALSMAVVLGPYLFNCWRVYGDPLYAINVHTSVYQATEGSAPADVGAAAFVEGKLLRRPFQTIETGVYGLTAYPFQIKWRGFAAWWTPLAEILPWCAVLGLLAWCFSRDGRVLLMTLAFSLLPFAFTWTIIGDWRFTEHAYPFFLLAACAAAAIVVELVMVWRPADLRREDRRRARAGASIAVGLMLLAVAFTWGMPALTAREALAAGEDVSLATGARDAALFRSGWSPVFGGGNVVMRVAIADPAVVMIPLPDARDFAITLRADPFPAPAAALPPDRLPSLALSINGVALPTVAMQWTPGRVGSYLVQLPRAALRRGDNRLEIRVVAPAAAPLGAIRGLTEASTISVWYVRVHPPAVGG